MTITDTPLDAATRMVEKAIRNAAYRARLTKDPVACFADEGIAVDAEDRDAVSQFVRGQVTQFEVSTQLNLPPVKVDRKTPLVLASDVATSANEKYVSAKVMPWGVRIKLSHQACADLKAGEATGVALACSAALAGIPGAQIPAVCMAIIAAYLAASAIVIAVMDRGKGVYLTLPWTSMVCQMCLGVPVPTPVT